MSSIITRPIITPRSANQKNSHRLQFAIDSGMRDGGVAGDFRIGRTEIVQCQLMDVIFTGQAREILQLGGGSPPEVGKATGGSFRIAPGGAACEAILRRPIGDTFST